MFKNSRFHVHDCVPRPDDIGAQVQDCGGRICYDMHNAEVIIIDGARCALSGMHAKGRTKVVDYTWVDHCIQQGRLLPYEYQASKQLSNRHTRSSQIDVLVDHVVATSIPVSIPGESSRATKAPAMSRTGRRVHFFQGNVDTSSPSAPLESTLLVPMPSSAVRSFSAVVGRAGTHPPELKAYFNQFLIAAWTLDPSKTMWAISKAITRLLPRLSEHSLCNWIYRNKAQCNDAKQQAVAARARGGITGPHKLDNEIQRTLRALSADRMPSSRGQVKSRPGASSQKRLPEPATRRHQTTSRSAAKARNTRQDSSSRGKAPLSALVGTTDIAALLKMSGKPPLPKDLTPKAKASYFDAILKWVLEREPTATQCAIGLLVYALGGDRFLERTFQGSYRTERRSRRYHEIRNSVLERWRSGELGNLGKDDAAALKRVNGRYHTHGHKTLQSPTPSSDEERDEAQSGSGDVDKADSVAGGVATAPQDDRVLPGHADEHRTPEDELQDDQPSATQLEDASCSGESLDPVNDDELRDLARYHVWFEEFVTKHVPEPDEREDKRAVIWRSMLVKHGRDEKYWQTVYRLRKTVVEQYAAQLRVRTRPA